MENPWKDVSLETYESHMSLSDVAQLQTLNRIMLEQVMAHPKAGSAVVIGVAGGNGLEHFGERFVVVYGIDINPEYLKVCEQRLQPVMGERLQLIELDMSDSKSVLPKADLVVADLLIEYVGVEIFCAKVSESQAENVSCVIQDNRCKQSFVSDSPYQEALQDIGRLHQDIAEPELMAEMDRYGYKVSYREYIDLPNGKQFVRVDFRR